MSVAEYISHLTGEPRSQWIGSVNRYLPPIVCAILVLTIAYKLAEITWALVPQTLYDRPPPEVAAGGPAPDADARTNFEALRNSHLFDTADEEPAAAAPPPTTILDAPNTTLNLKLSGVVVAENNGEESEAMITSGNQPEKLYHIGDTIEGASGATLHQVYRDRVILDRGGRLEALRVPEQTAPAQARRPTGRPAPPPVASNQPAPLRQVISDNASRLTNVVRFAPHVEGGQVVGFRVTPGRDSETFASLGLEPGDVVTDINGLTLDDPTRGLEAFEALGESTMANVTILRDGSPQVIVIDTTQLDALNEDRQ